MRRLAERRAELAAEMRGRDVRATRASAGTSSGCANARSIVSRARSIRRFRSSIARDTRAAYGVNDPAIRPTVSAETRIFEIAPAPKVLQISATVPVAANVWTRLLAMIWL